MNDYLLSVAEKIVYKSAPFDIIKKYDKLKKSLTNKEDIDSVRSRKNPMASSSSLRPAGQFYTQKKTKQISNKENRSGSELSRKSVKCQ